MTRHNMLGILRALAQHRNTSGYASQEDFVRLVGLLEISLMQEVLAMPQDEQSVRQKGYDFGKLLVASFQVKDNPSAHFSLGRFYATQLGYKQDADLYLSFIEGFVAGLGSEKPKELE